MLLLDRAQLPRARTALIDVWNAATDNRLPLTEQLWLQNVEEDPLLQDGDCIVREGRGKPVGFAVIRMLPPAEIEANPDMAGSRTRGHVMALAVHPAYQWKGMGSALLAEAENQLRGRGATSVALGGPPGHLVPGPPAERGDRGFWRRRGYQQGPVSVDLRRSLEDWVSPPPPPRVAAGEFSYRQGRPGEEGEIVEFLARAFPGRWRYDVGRFFSRGYRPADMTLLVDGGGTIQGFLCGYHGESGFIGAPTHWYPEMQSGAWGGVGPLGVAPDVRGGGLGLGLVAAGVDYLHGLGVRDCAIDWTGLADFYGKLGFRTWKSWLILEKALGAPGV